MPFIGQQPTTGAFLELDSLTASATANYTLQLNGANYYPESVNNLLVSINGVIQGSSTMSLSGAVLTVGATLSASDVIDFVRVFGNVGTISTPTDGSVTANKIGTGAVTNAKIADSTLDLTSKVTGVLPVANSQTNTPAFGAYLGSAQTVTNNVDTKLNINTEEFDTNSNFNTSNYRFTPTVAGKYYMFGQVSGLRETGNITRLTVYIYKNGSRVKQADLYINPTSQVLSALNINTFGIISMNGTSDYLELYGRLRAYNSGTIQIESGANHTFFGGYKLIGG